MTSSRRHPDGWDVIYGLALIAIGLPLAATMIFLFLGAPLVMAGIELLLPRPA
jgi:hypothetical protein